MRRCAHAILLGAILLTARSRGDAAEALTPAEHEMLEGLFDQFLFDPTGAVRVCVPRSFPSMHFGVIAKSRYKGWLVQGKDGRDDRVHFFDGRSIPAPPENQIEVLDFLQECQERYSPELRTTVTDQREVVDSNLFLAAWLYRLGHDALAAEALSREMGAFRNAVEAVTSCRRQAALVAYNDLLVAFNQRADEQVMKLANLLKRTYPREAQQLPLVDTITADLLRRRSMGTFGRKPELALPADYRTWPPSRKLPVMARALDEIDCRPPVWRETNALASLGASVVPELLDMIESDDRLTRCIRRSMNFDDAITATNVVTVRQVVFDAIRAMWSVQVIDKTLNKHRYTLNSPDDIRSVVAALRAYWSWSEHGELPPDERMMKVLTDPESSQLAIREAAVVLGERRYGPEWMDPFAKRPNPHEAIAKFTKPTAAEAILAAMDRDLANKFVAAGDSDDDRETVRQRYLTALVKLGDSRIGPRLIEGYRDAASLSQRCQWALAALNLGSAEPIAELARDFESGQLQLNPTHLDRKTDPYVDPAIPSHFVLKSGSDGLLKMMDCLAEAGVPEASRALQAVADPDHPLHRRVARRVLISCSANLFDTHAPWTHHPFYVGMLRRRMDCEKNVGGYYELAERRYDYRNEILKCSHGSPVPKLLANRSLFRSEASERACDGASIRMCHCLFGVPAYHPLFKDAAERLQLMKAAVDAYRGRYRVLTRDERQLLDDGNDCVAPRFAPNILALDRPATEEDVLAGDAVFHLEGKGRLTGERLPFWACLTNPPPAPDHKYALVVQAETDEGGGTTYGAVTARGLTRMQPADFARLGE
jgi:hypothetical protein